MRAGVLAGFRGWAVSYATDSARKEIADAFTAMHATPTAETANRVATALGAFQVACEAEAVSRFSESFALQAYSHLAVGLAAALPTDEPLLVDHMREARAILEAGMTYARKVQP